jgi:hypothetical protein
LQELISFEACEEEDNGEFEEMEEDDDMEEEAKEVNIDE